MAIPGLETAARAALSDWLADGERSQVAVAKALQTTSSAVSRWSAGLARPDPHLRKALEILTSGAVRERDWMTAEEVALIERVRAAIGPRRRRTTGVQRAVGKAAAPAALETGT